MDLELQLKLQAYFDGELSEREAREIGGSLAKDAEARALLAELRNTRGAITGYEADVRLPESRAFYWSKIARDIERAEMAGTAAPAVTRRWNLRRLLVSAAALAAVVIAVMLAGTHPKGPGRPELEVALADSDAFTYRDYSAGATLIWLSYPAESEFADSDADDTLD